MRIWKNELFKVVSRPVFVFLFALLVAVNAVLIGTASPGSYPRDAYKRAQAAVQQMPEPQGIAWIQERFTALAVLTELQDGALSPEEIAARWGMEGEELQRYSTAYQRGEYLDFTGDLYAEYFLFQELSTYAEQLSSYPAYLEEVLNRPQRSDAVSIFSEQDSFSRRNALKTKEAFQPLEGTAPRFTNSKMLNTAMDFQATDLLLLLLVFVCATCLITFEKESRMFALLKPTKHGKSAFIGAKLGVLLVLTAASVAALYGGSFIVTGVQYGFADLSVPVQSIAGYDGCALSLTVGGYLALFVLSKLAAAYLIGLFAVLAAITSRSPAMAYLKTLALLGASLALTLLIPANSAFQILKYANLIFFLRVTPIYQYYFTLNFFQFPVSMTCVFAVVLAVGILALTAAILYRFSAGETAAGTAKERRSAKKRSLRVHISVMYHELYKILITNKGLAVLLGLVLLQGYTITQQSSYLPLDEYYYRQYMTALQGPLGEQTYETVQKEQQRLAQQDAILEEAAQKAAEQQISEAELQRTQTAVQQQTRGRRGFERVQARLAYVEQLNQKAEGKEAVMVYETGWEQLTGQGEAGYREDMACALLFLLFAIALFSPVFSAEYSSGMARILPCCKNGRLKTLRAKLWICTALATLLFILSRAAQLIEAMRRYGLPCPNAPLSSLPSLADFPLELRLWQYLLLVYAVQYLAALCALLIILVVSYYSKNAVQAILLLSVILLIPPALHLLGIRAADVCSLNAFLSGSLYLDTVRQHSIWSLLLLLPAGIGAACLCRLRTVFRE